MVSQCPCGVASYNRPPPLHRPRSRVMFVFAPLSSIKTKRDTSMPLILTFHTSRLRFTSGRSCSAARSVFFSDDIPDALACWTPLPGYRRRHSGPVVLLVWHPAGPGPVDPIAQETRRKMSASAHAWSVWGRSGPFPDVVATIVESRKSRHRIARQSPRIFRNLNHKPQRPDPEDPSNRFPCSLHRKPLQQILNCSKDTP